MGLPVVAAPASTELARASLSALHTRFGELAAPNEGQLSGRFRGRFRAHFVGPWWPRVSAGPSLVVAGLPGVRDAA